MSRLLALRIAERHARLEGVATGLYLENLGAVRRALTRTHFLGLAIDRHMRAERESSKPSLSLGCLGLPTMSERSIIASSVKARAPRLPARP